MAALGRSSHIAGMAEGNAIRRNIPALHMIGYNSLQREVIDVERRLVAGIG